MIAQFIERNTYANFFGVYNNVPRKYWSSSLYINGLTCCWSARRTTSGRWRTAPSQRSSHTSANITTEGKLPNLKKSDRNNDFRQPFFLFLSLHPLFLPLSSLVVFHFCLYPYRLSDPFLYFYLWNHIFFSFRRKQLPHRESLLKILPGCDKQEGAL